MWWLFKKESDEEKARKARHEAAVRALETGEILPRAKERIELHQAMGKNFFSTDLTVNEHLLAKECGVQPIGQVMGTCFFRIGLIRRTQRATGEVHDIAQAHRTARAQAVYRMKKEAELYGADGIIGVRLKAGNVDYNTDMVEFTAIGTAVKVTGWDAEDLKDGPFASELNGQEFWQLVHAGYRPVNIVFGICCYYINTDVSTRKLVNRGLFNFPPNQEIYQYTRGFYDARERAMNGLQQDIEQFGADGCVGMSVESELDDIEYEISDVNYRDLLITFTAIGSSIKRMKKPLKPIERKPLTVLNLASKKFVSIGSRRNELVGNVNSDDDNDYDDE